MTDKYKYGQSAHIRTNHMAKMVHVVQINALQLDADCSNTVQEKIRR